MRHEQDWIEGTEGARLFTQAWLPAGEARSVVVLAHGLAEHSDRYGELVERLVARDAAVHAHDHRGHGRSSGRRAAIGRFSYLVEDLGRHIAGVRRRHGDRRVVLVGHSLGGAVALAAALARPDALAGLVLSAPAVGLRPALTGPQALLARLLSAIAPNLGAVRLPAAAVSRDPEVVRRYEQDPMVYRGAIPARTAAELLDAMTAVGRRAGELRVPVLVLHGTADQLVPLANAEPVYAALPGPDKAVRFYEGLYHEVFNEPERDKVFADLESWLDARR